ncbi:MAG: DUF1565 domain-containing protein [Coleofasciculaceae cyanobacterium SM2_1_6]|nr:DUF1565 domain-containing protein [Coleofasciculaceae cyanobacterium SM2_1_6]
MTSPLINPTTNDPVDITKQPSLAPIANSNSPSNTASNPTVYVNPSTGNNQGLGTEQSPYKTLTFAIQRVINGGIVILAPGNYSNGEIFPIIIPSRVMVIGNINTKGRNIIITGSGNYATPTFGNQSVTLRMENQSQLRGVTVTNPQTRGTGIWVESTNPVIVSNTFTNCGREGIFVSGMGKPLIMDNLFTINGASGISYGRSGKGEIRRNTFTKTGYGIALSDTTAPLIIDNTFTANHGGIFLSRQAKPVLRRNIISKNTGIGLLINEAAQPHLGNAQDPAGNVIRDNNQFDIQNNSTAVITAAGNQINPTRVQGRINFVATEIAGTVGVLSFTDIEGHWAIPFILALVSRQFISGFPDGTFQPEMQMNRAQYAALIAKTFSLPTRRTEILFRDVPSNFWAAGAINKAAAMGFIAGFPDGTFRGDQPLTKVQAIVSIVNGLSLVGGEADLILKYSDRAEIPSYATQAIATATSNLMIINYPQPDQLEPMRSITRAEVAVLVYNALVTTNKAPRIDSPYLVRP